ncbi:H-NS histone family protein [Herbaspirillum seropedicae]|uniref:Ler DNA-binding protein H-NS n=1 Tax=Herbaspirillum seropedicae (strain SmR1) TaxID=757424 RepID=D8IZM8_HERSS|nr:H-NS histone family protein [Herbaspirillum seropedicae]ADJ64368.1 Ler DNA-binding protein H-NS [Herbaspirillum seropedicae SmR1]AKN66302.1 hypothetical protein ACP92_14400 [Herbaspirillum seropedicae]AON55117.1 Ler DNA-binding protein H-NS [Herbaspirillum seropedicae]MDR6393807.1 DNA-binding protein H-NS [Herbaspirillum seropedicae]NQE30588.1 hypothetical protein [Herbaspirillum seropedicae]
MANSELAKLLAQQEELAQKIEEARAKEREPIIEQIKALIALHNITLKELGFKSKSGKAGKASAGKTTLPALYQNEDGLTWSGRGRIPLWLKDKNGEVSERLKKKYLISQDQEQQ